MNDALSGESGDDTINGGGGADSIEGGIGDDILNGGSGSDLYVFVNGHGSETLTDTSGSDDWIFYLATGGSTKNNAILSYQGDDLEITFTNGNAGDKITILGQNGSNASERVERIQFQDSTEYPLWELTL